MLFAQLTYLMKELTFQMSISSYFSVLLILDGYLSSSLVADFVFQKEKTKL